MRFIGTVADMIGYLDAIIGNVVEGWAVEPGSAEAPAALDVFIDDELIGEAIADRFREDLRAAGKRDGHAAFAYRIPLERYDGGAHRVRITLRSTGEALANGPLVFRGSPAELPSLRSKAAWIRQQVLYRANPREAELLAALRQRRRLAILGTYHQLPRFLRYHHGLVEALQAEGFVVVIAHATGITGPELRRIEAPDCFLYVKRNMGYDFGSWAAVILLLAEALPALQEMLLLNDSVIGPRDSLADALQAARQSGAGMVGLTDSYQQAYHLQSYFLWFDRAVCRSGLLPGFMAGYSFASEKDAVIREGELGLSQYLAAQGVRLAALHPYEELAAAWVRQVPQLTAQIAAQPGAEPFLGANDGGRSHKAELLAGLDRMLHQVTAGEPLNPSHHFWDVLLSDFDFPFLKREFLLANPAAVPTYFRLGEMLHAVPAQMRRDIMEIRRLYGGQLVPPIGPLAAPPLPLPPAARAEAVALRPVPRSRPARA